MQVAALDLLLIVVITLDQQTHLLYNYFINKQLCITANSS